MVAPSFEKYEKIGEAYLKENGKKYIKVKHPSTGNIREVRWYNFQEYAAAYGKAAAEAQPNPYGGLKQARGFSEGPILIIRNDKVSDEEWLNQSPARYAVGMGWYMPSTATLPDDTPEHFKFLLLTWDEFAISKETARSPQTIANILAEKEKKGLWINL